MNDEQSSGAHAMVLRRNIPLLGAYVAPRTQTERLLVKLWRDVLDMDQVGITDSYESLGIDSLLAASIFAAIEKEFKFPVPMASLIDASTVEQLARQIDALAARRVKSPDA